MFSSLALALALPTAALCSSVWVTEVPLSIRNYAIPRYHGKAYAIGDQVYRMPVTGLSSNYSFTVMGTIAPQSDSLGVLPHLHQAHYENFFGIKGSFQLWTQQGNETQESRTMLGGDWGGVPQNTVHTFKILEPETEMCGVIVPGGFETLFYALADQNYTSSTLSPYNPIASNASSSPSASVIASLTSFDVYAQLTFAERTDAVNGAAPVNSTWHNGNNSLAVDHTEPAYVAKNWGPKYLASVNGSYQIVQPFITEVQSQGNYTLSTITISKIAQTASATHVLDTHMAFQVLDGRLSVYLENETIYLDTGDVVFIKAGSSFQYWSEVAYTKVLYVAGGVGGLDTQLIEAEDTVAWNSAVWPISS